MRNPNNLLRLFPVLAICLLGCAPSPRTYSDSPNRTNYAALYRGNHDFTKERLRKANDPAEDLRPEWDRRQQEEWDKEHVDVLDFWCAGRQVIDNLDQGPNLYSDPALAQSDLSTTLNSY